ncbi:MAG: Rrf2 family transcriptional regulator [Anaerolineae bacterium]|nr:Rrf2 family transcriptional regulator [Anaerolineae bacterium]
MVISKSAYWALKAVVHLARRQSHHGPQISASVAEAIAAPKPGTASLLGQLAVAGVLVSFRGLGGGFLLARDPAGITTLEVCRAVWAEAPSPAADLDADQLASADSVDRLMQALSGDLHSRLASTTIADLVRDQRVSGASR